jgi:F0F1-type ATP synthase membrane subunit c/vacuolar-type H+-ATPase subunit K
VNEMKSKLGKLRLIQSVYIVAIPLFGWVAESVRGRGSSDWTLWHWVMTGLALYAALGGFFLRRKLMRRSEEALAKDASNPKALKQWQAGHLIGFASAEAIVIWGVVVRMVLGGALWQASLFYAAGLFLLLLWTPRMPITTPAST